MGGSDTIVARATPPGRGGVAVVRLSGPGVPDIAPAILGTAMPRPRYAAFRRFRDATNAVLDEGLALYFAGPASFTGEDILELHAHGGDIVVARLIARLHALGAREAEPGEFSRRAFLNGRLDLSQAEAIADLIDARSDAAAQAALRSLDGEFGRHVGELTEATTALRVQVESAIDFPDDEIDVADDARVHAQLSELERRLDETLTTARRGRTLRDGMQVVIIGHPNVGKSTLLNRLADDDTAIVTATPGTTRDTLREDIVIDGMPLRVIDTAGLRESSDAIEQEGVRRAWKAVESCDRVLLVTDTAGDLEAAETAILNQIPDGVGVSVVRNKLDRHQAAPGRVDGTDPPTVNISATGGDGMDALRRHLLEAMGFTAGGGAYSARQRHLDALQRARDHLSVARRHAAVGDGELMAEELGALQRALGEITGAVSSEDLLGRIFTTFCIGK